MTSTAATVEKLMALADVRINGSRPQDIQVHDERLYARLLASGALGLGESYMDSWWDSDDLAQLFCKLLGAHLDQKAARTWSVAIGCLKEKLLNQQHRWQAARNVHRHYDLGNDLYRNMLGRWMLYSSANWASARNLTEAGEAKFRFVCDRLGLQPGQKLLDIGCGWGGLARYAAQRHNVEVVGITLSREQAAVARENCSDLPVEIRYQDYRDLHERFDRIASLGMFEHVGSRNYRRFMRIVHRCLNPGGLFFLNTIGTNNTGESLNPWTRKYVFPGGMLPSVAQMGLAIDGLFVMAELQDWAEFYDKTLVAWFENFQANWSKLREHYGERFFRMWKYYLLSSAGAFRARTLHDWEILLAPST